MSLSMYQASAPVFLRQLGTMSAFLAKAAAAGTDLTGARLAADMLPLAAQVQIASDAAKGAIARLAAIETPAFPDDETGFDGLQQRIARTIDFVKSVSPAQIDGSEERAISLKAGPRELSFTGQNYLLHFALPNFFFHVTTAYAILRHNGVEIGKMDYLGSV